MIGGKDGASRQPATETALKIAAALERLAQVHRVLSQREASRHGLTPTQLRIVLALETAPARRHPAELAADLGVTRATLTDAVAALRNKRLLVQLGDTDDRRRTTLQLTGQGHRLAEQLSTWTAPVARRLAALLADDQGRLLAGLLQLIAGLQADGLVPHQRMCLTCRFFQPAPSRSGTHYCTLLDAPLLPEQLRIDCPEHQESA